MLLGTASGNADDGSSGILIPVGSSHARKCRNDIDPCGIRHMLRILLGLCGGLKHTHTVTKPLDPCTGYEHAALQGILYVFACAGSNSGQQTRLGGNGFVSGVH